MARIAIPDFQLANRIYAGATVTYFTVTDAGVKTTTLATLYDAFTGTETLANPVTLDGEGKFLQIPFIEVPVLASVSGLSIADHDTGVINAPPSWRGDWATATVLYPGDMVRDGSDGDNTKDLYVVVSQHTSDVWATDSADTTKLALALDISGLATTLPTPANPGDDGKLLEANGGAWGAGPQITSFAKTIIDDTGAAEVRTTIGALGAAGNGSGLTGVDLIGKKTIFVPAAAMRATVSNGCSILTDVETAAGRPDLQVLDFDDAADEHAQFQFAFPNSWNKGTVTFQVYWTVTAAVTTGVAWGIEALAVDDNEGIGTAFSNPIVVTDDGQSASNEMLVTVESPALTVQGSPSDGDITFFRVFRDVSDANDDMTQDARLIGVKLFFTTDAGNDA